MGRLSKELAAINDTEMTGVFLILRELINRSKLKSYELGFCSSIGASLVAWCCGIISVDPMNTLLPFYPELPFGFNFNKLLDPEIIVPCCKVQQMYDLLNQIEGVGAAVKPVQQDGRETDSFRLIIPEGESDGGDLSIESGRYYCVRILGSSNMQLQNRIAEMTGIAPDGISLTDPEVLEIFRNADKAEIIDLSGLWKTATGLPGISEDWSILYNDVNQQINSFTDLVRIDCLSYNVGAWNGIQEKLFNEEVLAFSDLITCREDVFEYAVQKCKLSERDAYSLAEHVRKGAGIPEGNYGGKKTPYWERLSYNHIPKWFADFCDEVRYLCSRVYRYQEMILSWRLAWYRLHYPLHFYLAYFECVAARDLSKAVFGERQADDRLLNTHRNQSCEDDCINQSFRQDCAVEDKVCDWGINSSCPKMDTEYNINAIQLIHGMENAMQQGKICDFRKIWATSNHEIYHCDTFAEAPLLQEQLLMLIKEAQMNGHRCTLHFDNPENGDFDRLFSGLESRIRPGDVSIWRKKRRMKTFTFDETRNAMDMLTKQLLEKESFRGIQTGFTELDHMTKGFRDGDLVLLGGRPGMGKTALALNLAENASIRDRNTVLYFSLAEPSEQLLKRMLFGRAEKDFDPERKVTEDEYYSLLAPYAEEICNAPLLIDDTPCMSADGIRKRCLEIAEKTPIKLIVIDYLQSMTTEPNEVYDERCFCKIPEQLKALAKEFGCPVLALTQLSRKVDRRQDHRPRLSDIHMVDRAEELADQVIFLYRDNYYIFEGVTGNERDAELIIAKNRSGRTGTVCMDWNPEYCRFMTRYEHGRTVFCEEEEITDLSVFLEKFRKKVFAYGFSEEQLQKVKDFYGDVADVTDITTQYQDILALPVDVVIINTDAASTEVVQSVQKYQREAEEADVEYQYLSEAQFSVKFEK